MIRLIVFDFDGTLGDTRANIVATMRETLRTAGYAPVTEEAIAATIGLILEEGFQQLYPGLSGEETLRLAALYRDIFEKTRKTLIPTLFPHVKETLTTLKERGYILTIASSRRSASLNGFLRDMSIANTISYVLGADSVEKAKPDPEPVLKTLRALSVPPSECLVVGDMPVDILMGRAAGAATCAVTYGNASRDALAAAGADFLIDDIAELPRLPLL